MCALSDSEIEIRRNYTRRIRLITNEDNRLYNGNASKLPYSKTKLPSKLPTINAQVTIKLSENTCQELKDLVYDVYYSGDGRHRGRGSKENGITYDQLVKHLISLVKQKGIK